MGAKLAKIAGMKAARKKKTAAANEGKRPVRAGVRPAAKRAGPSARGGKARGGAAAGRGTKRK
jgi:hypothetical protein